MDQYKISQRPSGAKKPVKRKKKIKAATRKQSKSVGIQPILIIVVIVGALLLGGVVFARYILGKDDTPTANNVPGAIAKQRANETGTVSEETFNGVTNAIGNKQTSGLSAYYASNVRVRILKNNTNKTVSKSQVDALIRDFINNAATPWDWHVPPADLSAWQQGPHKEEFIGNVIVGISPDGTVIVVHIDEEGNIDEIFIAPVEELTNPPNPSDSSNPNNNNPPAETTPETPAPNPTAPTDTAD